MADRFLQTLPNWMIDNGEFARLAKERHGKLSLSQISRVAESVVSCDQIAFDLVGGRDARHRLVLTLALSGELMLTCRRCAKPLLFSLAVTTCFTLFATESQLEQAEAEDEFVEGLLLDEKFDLLHLIEDEVLLSLPYAPAHEVDKGEICGGSVHKAAGRLKSAAGIDARHTVATGNSAEVLVSGKFAALAELMAGRNKTRH